MSAIQNYKTHYRVQLNSLKMLILTSTDSLVMELDYMEKDIFHIQAVVVEKNVIIFRVDMSSSKKIDNRERDILILGKGPTQGLEHTMSAEENVFN